MNKLFFTTLLCTVSIVAFSQPTKAIISNGAFLQMGDFNPGNGTFAGLQDIGYLPTPPHDFIYDAKNGKAI